MMTLIKFVSVTVLAVAMSSAASAQQLWIIGTGAQGSLAFSTGSAIAKLMNSKTKHRFRVRAMGGSSTVLPQVNVNKVHLSMNNALETRHVYMGEGTFKGKALKNTRIILGMYPLRVVWAVANNSKIRTMADAKGARIPSEFTSQTIFVELTKTLLASASLKIANFKGVPVSHYIKGGDLLARGKVDMAIVSPGSGGSRKQHAQMKKVGGIRFIPIGSNIKAMQKVFAETYPQLVKKNAKIPGLMNDIIAMDYPFYLTTNKFMPAGVIYDLTKTMYENKAYLRKAFGIFGRWNPDKHIGAKHSTTPFHPGAVKYLKEKGIWRGGIEG
jgi:TRAP transporter TAXI family solute receptor